MFKKELSVSGSLESILFILNTVRSRNYVGSYQGKIFVCEENDVSSSLKNRTEFFSFLAINV